MNFSVVFYGEPFLLSFALSSFLCVIIIYLFNKFPFTDIRKGKGKRHIHKKYISRFGGIAIIIATMTAIFLNGDLFFDKIVWSIAIGGILILFLGVIDDIKPVSWMSQLFVQVVIVLFAFIMGIRTEFITNPFGGVIWLVSDNFPILSLLFMLVWVLVIMNAINWCDGIDGLASGIIFIAASTLFVISLQPHINQPPIAILSIILAGSVFGFFIFNFPPAKIFAGSSGSFFMGYAIALLAISAGAKIGTTILVLAVPLIDAVWVVINRIYRRKSIFQSDDRHFHHRLLEKGWSVNSILALYYGITIICAMIAVSTNTFGKIISLVAISCVVLVFFIMLAHDDSKSRKV